MESCAVFDAIPGGGGEGAVSVTAPGECRRPSLVEANHDLVQKVWDSWARIDRQMSELPAQAKRLRTLATDLNVNAALNGDPKIQSAMFRIADQYERMAHSAEMNYERYLRRRRLLEIREGAPKIRVSSSPPLWTKPRR